MVFMSIGRSCFLAIVSLFTLLAGFGANPAQAGFGIIIDETILMPVGDPLTQYDFKLSLAGGNQLLKGDNLTILNIPNYNGQASYVFMSDGTDFSKFFTISVGGSEVSGQTTLSLTWNQSIINLTNTQSTNLSIGDLYVVTSVEFPPSSNSPLFNPIIYNTQTHTYPSGLLNLGIGGITMPSIVPEPSSWALVGVGFAAVGWLARGPKRRVCVG